MSEIFKAMTRAGAMLDGVTEAPPHEDERLASESTWPIFVPSVVEVGRVRDRAMRALARSDSAAAEQMRVVRTKVHALDQAFPFRVWGVVSATPREGKTTLAFGVATAMAQEDSQRVLVIEANLRRPQIAKRFGIPSGVGLSDWLEGRAQEIPVRRLEPYGFSLLEAGSPCESPGDLLARERMEHLLARARVDFDHVIVDCTALTPVADAVVLQDMLDGFLLVVRSRFTRQDVIQRALTHLKKGSIKGVVFQAHRVLFR